MKSIKNILLLMLLCMTTLILTACGNKNVEGSLEEIMEKIYSNIPTNERPMMLQNIDVDENEDSIEYYIGTKDIEYDEILASEPGIGSIAYSVVLIRMKDNADIAAANKKILENVNPRKWVCVSVPEDKIIVKNKGNLIILIMVADDNTRAKLEEGFDNL